MKIHNYFLIFIPAVILITAMGSVDVTQATHLIKPVSSLIAPAFPLDHWKFDYLYTPDSAGTHVSLAFDPDHEQAAWISYYNETDGSLWVMHFVGAGGGGSCGLANLWICDQVDQESGEQKGLYTSIDIFPDVDPDPDVSTWKVGVTYYDAANDSLKYAEYSCPSVLPCLWNVENIQSATEDRDNLGLYTSFKFDSSGIPHIAYHVKDDSGENVRYYLRHAYFLNNSSGNCGETNQWQCEDVYQLNKPTGLFPSLDIDYQDRVYIAFYNESYERLDYVISPFRENAGNNLVWPLFPIDQSIGDIVGLFPSFHAPQNSTDVFQVAYYDATHGRLKYASSGHEGTGNCSLNNSWQCDPIDEMGIGLTWASISMAVDSNHIPMIAYTNRTEELSPLDLKIAEPAENQPYANCAGGSWWCGTLDSGGAYVDEAGFISLGVKPGGLAIIVYSELDSFDYPSDYDLKIAYQTLSSFLPVTMK